MQTGSVTTPFGRRQISLAHMTRQLAAKAIQPGKSVDKWKVFRDASEARQQLGLQDRSLAVLDALLSFYPDNKLAHDAKLVVFPSNTQLSLRAHGIAGATLRRHLALLVEVGLILRKDSANGKRYARKDRSGEIESAFGFDLSPLLARAEELAAMAQSIVADRVLFRRTKENLTICRRDVRKLLAAAIAENHPGDWQAMEARYAEIVASLSRTPTIAELTTTLNRLEDIRSEIVNQLELQEKVVITGTNAAQDERHIEISESESISEKELLKKNVNEANNSNRPARQGLVHFDLVVRACPQISDYGPGGMVSGWRDLMTAASVVRAMLNIAPSAYDAACGVLTPQGTAAVIACILERVDFIKSPGGYLRDLTRRAEEGRFSLAPMLMALLKSGGSHAREAGLLPS